MRALTVGNLLKSHPLCLKSQAIAGKSQKSWRNRTRSQTSRGESCSGGVGRVTSDGGQMERDPYLRICAINSVDCNTQKDLTSSPL
jgi:hypothetical protein